MEILLPPWLCHARLKISYSENTGVSRSPYNGLIRTATFGGDRLSASLEFIPVGGTQSRVERGALMSFLSRLRGRQNRAYLWDHNPRRGSFPSFELLDNNLFAEGTDSWFNGPQYLITATEQVLRGSRSLSTAASTIVYQYLDVSVEGEPLMTESSLDITTEDDVDITAESDIFANDSLVRYAPYIARWFTDQGAGTYLSGLRIDIGSTPDASEYKIGTPFTTYGMHYEVAVATSPSISTRLVDASSSGQIAGNFVRVPYVSLSRCALVDNGANLLLWSDDFTNAAWIETQATMASVAIIGTPDGTSSAYAMIESLGSSEHYVSQTFTVTAAVQYVSFSVSLKSGLRTWAKVSIGTAYAFVNLTTGAVGTVGYGAGWGYPRAVTIDQGDGWCRIHMFARKTGTQTSATVAVYGAEADNDSAYSGDDNAGLYLWRGSASLSEVPGRVVLTTAAATTGTSQTGSALYLKGLPESAEGLLLSGDKIEVITSRGSELKIVNFELNSDSVGHGYLQFEPPLRGVPADNAPVIIHQPMGRFIFAGDFPEWNDEPGLITRASADFEEA